MGRIVDRRDWLLERRAAVEASYDAEAPSYDENPYPVETQGASSSASSPHVRRTGSSSTPRAGPASTSSWSWSGPTVVGIDQSRGMLEEARSKGLAAALDQVGLQELAFVEAFDGVMSIDAMENVFPEDWPLVARQLPTRPSVGRPPVSDRRGGPRRGYRPRVRGHDRPGLPVVSGEVVEGDTGGYHYYPGRGRWPHGSHAAGLEIVEQETEALEDWGYWHLLLRVG